MIPAWTVLLAFLPLVLLFLHARRVDRRADREARAHAKLRDLCHRLIDPARLQRADGRAEILHPQIGTRAPCLPEGCRALTEEERCLVEGGGLLPVVHECGICVDRITRPTLERPGAVFWRRGFLVHAACAPGYHPDTETCPRCAGTCIDPQGAGAYR
jgi:hypothetical protein